MIPALIPARGGSKGIPKKNIIPFRGTPLIAYTIEQAKASSAVDDVFVTTDSAEIAGVSREWGAKVINRPSELAQDTSATEPALVHAVTWLEDQGYDVDPIVLLQCTSPVREPADIDGAVAKVVENGYDSALTCCEDHSFYWTVTPESAEASNYDPSKRARRQDMDQQYLENGSVYVTDQALLMNEECRLGGDIAIQVMPKHRSFEIDSHEDLRIAEAVADEFDFYTGAIEME